MPIQSTQAQMKGLDLKGFQGHVFVFGTFKHLISHFFLSWTSIKRVYKS